MLTPAGRAAARSGLLVPSILPNSALSPLEWVSAPPVREEIFYPGPEGPMPAVLHHPGNQGSHPAVVLLLGLDPLLADPRVVRLNTGLARAGWVVLLPRLERLSQHRVGLEEVEALVAAFRFLEQLPYVDPARIGCGGLSVGASLCFIASAQEEIRDQVLFVNFFGGYESAERLIVSVTTGVAFDAGSERIWDPHPEMISYLRGLLIQGLESETDRAVLLRRFFEGEGFTTKELDLLSPQGRVLYQLLTAEDPAEAWAHLEALPERERERLSLLSPAHWRDSLQAQLFIMHDASDTHIPVEESRRLASGFPDPAQVRYTEFRFFEHVTPQESVGPLTLLREGSKLFRHLHGILHLVEGQPDLEGTRAG
ncbi:MAG: alpha/beta hydrolase family protein [Anaerolineae bacterium]